MTRFRALVISGALMLGFGFGGCFDHGGEPPCQLSAGAGGDQYPCPQP